MTVIISGHIPGDEKQTYMPRPNFLKIADGVAGQGLFTTEAVVGVVKIKTHFYTECPHALEEFPDGWVRIGIGGWYNLASKGQEATCTTEHCGNQNNPKPGDYKLLVLEDLPPNIELLADRYTLPEYKDGPVPPS